MVRLHAHAAGWKPSSRSLNPRRVGAHLWTVSASAANHGARAGMPCYPNYLHPLLLFFFFLFFLFPLYHSRAGPPSLHMFRRRCSLAHVCPSDVSSILLADHVRFSRWDVLDRLRRMALSHYSLICFSPVAHLHRPRRRPLAVQDGSSARWLAEYAVATAERAATASRDSLVLPSRACCRKSSGLRHDLKVLLQLPPPPQPLVPMRLWMICCLDTAPISVALAAAGM